VIKKLIVIFIFFAITVIPLQTALARDEGYGGGKGTRQLSLGKLVLSITEASANGNYLLKFSKGKEEVFACECAIKTHEPKTVPNTPRPNCRTLLAYCFSGGAHCCTTLFIATEWGSEVSLDMVDFGHTDGEVKFIEEGGTLGKVIKVPDWQFAYYGSENSQIEFSFADSPVMTRLLVFDNGHWRVDRVGEFTRFYSRLFREALHKASMMAPRNEPELTASLAMKAAYYDLMNGKPVEEAGQVLNQLFPVRWKHQAGTVIRDIYRAVSEFNPVEVIR
jgi:hypothetical protein